MSICAAVSVKKISSLWLLDANWKTTPIIWVVFESGDVVRAVVLVLRRLHLAFLDSEQQGVRRVVAVMPSFLFRSFWSRIIMSWTIVWHVFLSPNVWIMLHFQTNRSAFFKYNFFESQAEKECLKGDQVLWIYLIVFSLRHPVLLCFYLHFFVSINVTICCFQGLQGEKGEKVTNIVLEFAAAEGAHTMFSVKYSYLV